MNRLKIRELIGFEHPIAEDAIETLSLTYSNFFNDSKVQTLFWLAIVKNILPNISLDINLKRKLFDFIHQSRSLQNGPPVVWRPSKDQMEKTNIYALMKKVGKQSVKSLHRWSMDDSESFWLETLNKLGVIFKRQPKTMLRYRPSDDKFGKDQYEKPGWLDGGELNIVDSCFMAPSKQKAIIWSDGEEFDSNIPNQDGYLKSITFGELEILTNRISNGLLANGFKPGDRIAIYMPMIMESIAAYLGLIRAGMVAVCIADSIPLKEVSKRLAMTNTQGVFTVDFYTRSGRVFPLYDNMMETKVGRIIVVEMNKSVKPGQKIKLRRHDIEWQSLISETTKPFTSSTHIPTDTISLLFSSGTTGEPKLIPWTHVTPIKASSDGYYHQDIHQGDVICWPTNIGWMMGLWLIFQLINKATLALFYNVPKGAEFGRFVQDANVNILGVIPSLVKNWMQTRDFDHYDWSRIRCFSSTGECSHPNDIFYLMDRTNFNAPVIEYCGGTEVGGGYISSTMVQDHALSTFTTPTLGSDFIIIMPNGNHQLLPGEIGEVFLIAPALGLSESCPNRSHHMEYYQNVPNDPENVGRHLRRHGDEIMVLSGGFFRLMGRTDDNMNLGGIKVSSVEIECIVMMHDYISEVAAVGCPIENGQSVLVLFVVINPKKINKPKDLRAELQFLIRDHLNPLFKIYDILKLASIPRTPSNKIMRKSLRDKYIHKMVTSKL